MSTWGKSVTKHDRDARVIVSMRSRTIRWHDYARDSGKDGPRGGRDTNAFHMHRVSSPCFVCACHEPDRGALSDDGPFRE